MADDKKKVSGKWEWLSSDTAEQIANILIYGAAVGGIAILEQVQVLHFENAFLTSAIGLIAGYGIDALRRWKKDNSNAEG